jgi:hypothetical protein
MVSVDVATESDRPEWKPCERGGRSMCSSDPGEFPVAEDSALLKGEVDVYDGGCGWKALCDDAVDWRCGAG